MDQPKTKKPKTEQELAKEWDKKSRKLDEEYGFQRLQIPAFKLRDDGTWSIILQPSIGRLPKQK